MAIRSSAEIRQGFLEFFARRDHTIVPSSPLVPASDPTLLFTNAGMVPFKDLFLGREERPYRRAASCQCCVRAGGKHNDLENVGYTARHHTFFEMLGNFSFGDYFKREAIGYAWAFLTETLCIDPARLWVTVFDSDEEAVSIWLDEIKIDRRRLSRCGEQDNFWTMGATGPCGPCSEVYYDHGPGIAGGPPGSPEQDGERFVEIWNLVFTQFDRDAAGVLHPIPRPSVDTGMGLERIAAVLQGVHSNYETDCLRVLVDAAAALCAPVAEAQRSSLQVIADHLRACTFIIAEGVLPSNEGRGYVLRRIVRRAVRHGHRLGLREPFFYRLVEDLVGEMGAAYPHIIAARPNIERVLKGEEMRFADTLEQGLKLLERSIDGLAGTVIPGRDVFQLYDTYGFPVDLTADIARERGLRLDLPGFEREMEAQRARARAASAFGASSPGRAGPAREAPAGYQSAFSGYETLRGEAEIIGIYRDGEAVTSLPEGAEGAVVLDRTPFYAEAGGQVGDRGVIHGPAGRFNVGDTQRLQGLHLHFGTAEAGTLRRGDRVKAEVDAERRRATALNHSATHLLHAALRRVLGSHVTQKGSLVAPERLRFDFSHAAPLTDAEIGTVERLVNREVRANHTVETRVMPIRAALESGAMALFGEHYDEEVRVLGMGEFSLELCGGTHVQRTGDIGLFAVISETGIGGGVRRIEALTGEGALAWVAGITAELRQVAELLKIPREHISDRVEQLVLRLKQEEKQNLVLRARLSSRQGQDLSQQAIEVAGAKVVAELVEEADAAGLRRAIDGLKDKLGRAAVVLGTVQGGKVLLVAGVSKELSDQLGAGELVNFVAQQVGGKGGGRPDLAQAGGTDPERLGPALASVAEWVRSRLAN